jgi:Tfp pilus assembly protein PilZ
MVSEGRFEHGTFFTTNQELLSLGDDFIIIIIIIASSVKIFVLMDPSPPRLIFS